MTFPFNRESGLIIVNVEIDNKYELKMILDTGATNTTIDSNAMYLLGYDLKDSVGTVEIETASGIIETEVFEMAHFSALGLVETNFQIQPRAWHHLGLQRSAWFGRAGGNAVLR